MLICVGTACGGSVERVSLPDAVEAISEFEPALLSAAQATIAYADARALTGNERCLPAPAGLRAGALGRLSVVCPFTDGVIFYHDASYESGLVYMAAGGETPVFDACVRAINDQWTQFRVSGDADPECAPGFKWRAGG